MEKKKSICIISFSPIYRDARVLRQIKYLSPHYDLTVIGYGEPHPHWKIFEIIKWHVLETPVSPLIVKMAGLMFLALGKLTISFYDHWYWRKGHHRIALEMAIANKCDAYHANDWEALPVAAEAAKKNNAKLVFDAHEYAPLELENRWYWKVFSQPAITYFIKKYAQQISSSITVAPLISERYKQEFGFDPIVVLNAAEGEPLSVRKPDINNIRLIYHGVANRERRLDRMIETLKFCDQRFTLHLLLINSDTKYLKHLKTLANELTPGRVTFHEPVKPEEIVRRIFEYDIGFYLLEPKSYNNIVALPNKFFDFIAAGLVVCIGPSPSMAELLYKHEFGVVAPSFNPQDVANVLNQLTMDQLAKMRFASFKASEEINAVKEMSKLVNLYTRLFYSN